MTETPLTPDQIAAAELKASQEGYIHRTLVGFDQFVGSLIGIQNDQTISSATAIAAHKHVWYRAFAVALNDSLNLIQANHGEKAQAGDIERAKKVIATDSAALGVPPSAS